MTALRATVAADAAGLEEVHALLERFWHERGPGSDADRIAVELAVLEIAGNVVRHGVGAPYEVTLCSADGRVVAEIDEPGPALPPDIVSASTMPGQTAESGRGLALARAAVDELAYEHRGGTNHWTIRRAVSDPAD